jgi:C4-dicarboxylate-specific signal transduction histidine kinase
MRKFDYSLAQLTTKTMHSLLEEIDPASPLNRVLNEFGSLDFKPITNCEVIAKRSDASFFPVMLSIKKMRDTPKAEYLVTIVDISKRKQLEQRLQELNEQLEFKVIERTQALQTAQGELVRSEKMIALGKMSTAIVHELNQPLTAFRNYLAIIDKVKQHPEAVAERLESLNHLVDNMAAITSQLRLFAYSNPHSDRQVKVFDVVKRVVSMMSSLISEQQIEFLLRFSPQAETAIINADNTRFEQVLSNLFKNAIDAMTTKAQLGKVRQLSLRLDCQNNNLVLTLTDTGGGVNSDQLASLFEPFYTTKEIGLGLGLGLSIVKSIVQDLQGAICFNNIEQPQGPNGLQFRLEFPLHQKRE